MISPSAIIASQVTPKRVLMSDAFCANPGEIAIARFVAAVPLFLIVTEHDSPEKSTMSFPVNDSMVM